MFKTWDDDTTATAVKLWGEGLSATGIARRIGGLTRNAVIGKIHRLGLKRDSTVRITRTKAQNKVVRQRQRQRAPKPATEVRRILTAMATEPLPAERPDDIARVSFAALEAHHCRWPVGEVGQPGFGFCGCKPVDGAPYCTDHVRRAFTGVQPVRIRPPVERYARKLTTAGGKYVLAEV